VSDERFEIRGTIGAGGMGVVYEAFDRERGTAVALKALPRLDGDALHRFKQEFRAVQDLRHPNLVELGELIEQDGQWFISMELVRGVDFLAYVRGGANLRTAGPSSPSNESPTTILEDTASSQQRVRASVDLPEAPPPVDEERLRHALAQLCRGLLALHAANKVHRDIKPSNVLVTEAGDVKVLDFGLIAEAGSGGGAADRGMVVGTPNYMAPEQALGNLAGPEADWYSVGVALFVALTGAPPFLGQPDEVMVQKQLDDAPPASVRVPGIAPDLEDLAARLLRRDPALRATGRDVLAVLEGDVAGAVSLVEGFVGREAELILLQRSLEDSRAAQVTMLVAGESGVGKSALVRRFVRGLRLAQRARRPPIVLHGRCYEREAVPYKAFDGVVDALAEHLGSLPMAVQQALLPEDASLLARVFPVLERVPAIDAPDEIAIARVTPQMLRTRVFLALRSLLGRLASRGPLAIVIDDLQWSDADSLALLREVLRAPGAPNLLLLATLRVGPGAEAAATALPGSPRRLELGGLPPDRARELVEQLFTGRAEDRGAAEAIAAESGGHPMFLAELVRHALVPGQGGEAGGSATPRLEEAIASRLRRLDAAARATLAVLAVASGPLTFAQAARAAGTDLADLGAQVSMLRAERLVTTTGARRGDLVEPYHDRVRAAARGLLGEGERSACHGRLASAIELDRPDDHEALATHWAQAGEAARARGHAVKAAERAREALAFNHAAALYRLAISLGGGDDSARALQAELGRVLSWAGHGLGAAEAYREAARSASEGESLELRRRAAEQLLSTGHLEEGLGELRGVLDEAGLGYPASRTGAIASLLLERGRVRLRGLSFRDRREEDIPPEQLARVDVCWAAVVGLSMMDTVRGADFQARNLRLALDAGEPYRVCRALAWESAMETALGAYPRAEALASAAHALAKRLDDPPQLRALITACGATAAYLSGRWKETRRLIAEVESISRSEWSDEARYELDNGRMLANAALTYLGEVGSFHDEFAPLVAEARERHNVHILTNLQSGMNIINFLARGRNEDARRMLDEAIGFWSPERIHIPHFVDLYGRVQTALYEGDGHAAHQSVEAMRPRLARSLLLHGPYFRLNVRDLAGRSAVAAAAASTDVAAREPLLRAAEGEAAGLEGERVSAWASPLAKVIRAGVAAVRGDEARSVDALRDAATGFAAADMLLHASAVRRQLGALLGGDEGRALVDDAEAWMSTRTVTRYEEISAILAPGLG